jgi:hypothetical protein
MKLKYSVLIKFTLSVAILSTLGSCEKDFLEPESLSTFDKNFVFSNVDDARNAVNAMYAHFNQDAFRSRLSNNMTGNTDIEHSSGWTSDGDRYQIWRLDAVTSNRDLDIVWTYAYRAIRDANIAIEGLTQSGNLDATDESVRITFNHLLGECYTLRAFWYSMLTFYFGDVPYVTSAPVAGGDFLLPKTDRNQILSAEIDAMKSIEENMLWADQLPYGIEQINREYTLALIARIALQRGGYFLKPDLNIERSNDYLDYYQVARDYSNKLITNKDRPLPTDFRQIFMNLHKFISPVNEDILLEVPFPIGSGDVAWNIGIDVNGGSNATHDYGSGNNYMQMPITYYLSFDNKDKRREITCGLYKIDENFQYDWIERGISQGKFGRHWLENPPGKSTAKGTGINWPMMRYSDVLLMFAEAENELNGPTSLASEALKRVRQRAFDANDWSEKVDQYVATAAASKEAFFNAIVDERAWEFGGEMIRKYELIRWGIYDDKIKETVDGLKLIADRREQASTYNLPDYIFWKVNADGQFEVLNPDSYLSAAPDDTWTRESFINSLWDDTKGNYQDFILRDWENHLNPPWGGNFPRYIFPIPTSAIEASQGKLLNDGYQF